MKLIGVEGRVYVIQISFNISQDGYGFSGPFCVPLSLPVCTYGLARPEVNRPATPSLR